jgi:hypothetical protein
MVAQHGSAAILPTPTAPAPVLYGSILPAPRLAAPTSAFRVFTSGRAPPAAPSA